MLVVGLTGGIGCGKSEVRRRLTAAGIDTIDADTLAKVLLDTNELIMRAIKEEFGENMYDQNGRLQRKALAAIVFNDRQKLEILNGIVHPRVISTVERMLEGWQEEGKTIAVVEAALHYEVNWHEAMDAMVVVSASMENRIKRIMQRDSVDEAGATKRMGNQLPLDEKVKRADYVVENNGDLQQLDLAVQKLVAWLHEKAAQ